ncbi:uncharacterized protein K452DRAFT_285933 [Aplosporella prunicola CBS 121167]|uniref:Uncharacterized protein n=1 Tax=Aplosporella prunicola CBS 121167 TaxID=1176127 RepID=A0A6A6BKU5_9PEZI|nr:uncharacterized protein K452DRAFT_285933 [Aplosporella prunicola CBS 121167]KAF2143894.1 hypothetical protein K452DRAFT_285933 [Aplosporella prunicola CBS 121167]
MFFILLASLSVWSVLLPVTGQVLNTSSPATTESTIFASKSMPLSEHTWPVSPTCLRKKTMSPYELGHANSYSPSVVTKPSRIVAQPSASSINHSQDGGISIPTTASASYQCPTDQDQAAVFDSDLFVAILFGTLSFVTAMVNIWLQYEALQRRDLNASESFGRQI